MTTRSIDIDQVVREVLAQLGLAPQGTSAPSGPPETKPAAASPKAQPAEQPAAEPDEHTLVVTARLVTIRELDGNLGQIRRVVVPPDAVVTPAVRDELDRKHIELKRQPTRPTPNPGAARVVMITLGKSYDPARLTAALQNDKLDADSRRGDCLMAASDEFARELADGRTLGVMLTSQPAIALCLANRLPGVRAILGDDVVQMSAFAAAVGANLLVLAPRGKTLFQLKHMVREFCRDGVRACPDLLKERLS